MKRLPDNIGAIVRVGEDWMVAASRPHPDGPITRNTPYVTAGDIMRMGSFDSIGELLGFTREHVKHLRDMADSRVVHGHGDYGPPDQYDPWITELADRIEALLPPEA